MNTIKMVAQERKGFGKELTRKVRNEGQLPAVIYGRNQESISISLDYQEMYKSLFKGMGKNNLYTLTVGKKTYDVIPYELQIHPISREVRHIDFKIINETEKVRIKLSIKQTGVAIGVKKGGKLEQKMQAISLMVLPTEIPKNITVDVESLEQGQELLVKALTLPASAEVLKASMTQRVFVLSAPSAADELDEDFDAPVNAKIPAAEEEVKAGA